MHPIKKFEVFDRGGWTMYQSQDRHAAYQAPKTMFKSVWMNKSGHE